MAWQRHVGSGEQAQSLFESILARHREPGRHYHDLRHVTWVVRHVVDLAARFPVDDLDAVVAAAFFHDAIYAFGATDDAVGNEEASARLAARTLRELGWDRGRADRVAAMIVATEHRAGQEAADVDTAVLLAADLAVLAAEPAAYADAARNIRKEYGHLDAADWRAGRSEVLRGFLARDHIYPPQLQLDAWERRARANLAAELAALG